MPGSRDENIIKPKQNINKMLEHANALLLDLERVNQLNNNNQQDVKAIAQHVKQNLHQLQKSLENYGQHHLRQHLARHLFAALNLSLEESHISEPQKQLLRENLNQSLDKAWAASEPDPTIATQFETLLQDINLLVDLHR